MENSCAHLLQITNDDIKMSLISSFYIFVKFKNSKKKKKYVDHPHVNFNMLNLNQVPGMEFSEMGIRRELIFDCE